MARGADRFAMWVVWVVGMSGAAPAWAAPSVTATATSWASQLDLDGTGTSGTYIVKVADVVVSTANVGGCTLTITSGILAKAGGAPIAYQVTSVADGASAPVAGDFTVPSGNNYTYDTGAAGSVNRDVYIRYTTVTSQDPGTYNESVSFSVVDN